ncbi:MAG: hypothetical protein ACRDOK_04510 [Streptosporangiaceae bacterium]
MTTIHQRQVEQNKRPDPVGQLAWLWRSYDHPKLSGLASVVKSLNEHARLIAGNPGAQVPGWPGEPGAEWIAPAIAQAVAEYRGERAPTPEAVAGQSARLAAVEEQLRLVLTGQAMIMTALGIGPLEASEPAGSDTELANQIAGSIGGIPVVRSLSQQVTALDWPGWYAEADHTAVEADGA